MNLFPVSIKSQKTKALILSTEEANSHFCSIKKVENEEIELQSTKFSGKLADISKKE